MFIHDLVFSVQKVASSCLGSSLLKYSAKEYFFRASLCHLSVDLLNAQYALGKYVEQYPAFQDSREHKLVKVCIVCIQLTKIANAEQTKLICDSIYSQQTLCEHLEEQNIEGFTDAVKDYDSISRLDQWYTTMLLRIKRQHNEDPDLR